MTVFSAVLGFTGAMLVLALAAFGILSLAALLTGQYTMHRRLTEQARKAELEVAELGRRAQVSILNEALRRAQSRAAQEAGGPPSGGHAAS